MRPHEEAAAILRHYFCQLAKRTEAAWSEANDRDFDRMADLLESGEAAELDSIPPYAPPIVSDRVTQVFDRDASDDYGDPEFERWRKQKQAAENDRTLRRMFEREERGR